MARRWVHESPARWDADKARIVGGAPAGIFDDRLASCREGELIPGEWWRVEDQGEVLGYGWLDVNWGDAEILLATAEPARGRGVGTFILDQLGREAHQRGLNYMYNIVRPTHPQGAELATWLRKRGFVAHEDGRLVRAALRSRGSAR